MWGKPTWGAWWVWDARLTSELISVISVCGSHACLRTSIDDLRRADRSSAVFALVGVVNVPIIYFSVQLVEHVASRGLGQHGDGTEDGREPC